MRDNLLDDIRKALRDLQENSENAYTALENAWRRTVLRQCENGRQLVPFVGSGLNALAVGGVKSWEALVNKVEIVAASRPWTRHQLETAGLTFPQRLELSLAACLCEKQKDQVVDAFDQLFSGPETPSQLHKRLVQTFPHIVTTNYNHILSKAPNAPKTYDLTDPHADFSEGYIQGSAIFHLHGVWEVDEPVHEKRNRIFRYVDPQDTSVGPVLVLTENQYHRQYANSGYFQRAVHHLFAGERLLLFIGSGLNADELGIHAYLRDLQSSYRSGPVGIYLESDLNPAKVAFLQARGLAAVNLPEGYGCKPPALEAVWHAFFDALDERFGSPSNFDQSLSSQPFSPEVLCVGLSSRQTVISLSNDPGTERSHWIPKGRRIEEAGGQHLLPALELIRLGHKVALATRLGDDDDGDWVLKQAYNFVIADKGEGDLNTRLVIRSSEPYSTRNTFVITYPTMECKESGKDCGTRVIFDYEGHDEGSNIDWISKTNSASLEDSYRRLFQSFKNVKVLYLGPYGLDFQRLILEELQNTELRFFETGTSGGPRLTEALKIAGACTHVLASAEFVVRVASANEHSVEYYSNATKVDYQKKVFEKLTLNKDFSLLAAAHRGVFGSNPGCLVVTLGVYGSAFYEVPGTHDVAPFQHQTTDESAQVAWIGCGDMFRAQFIHALLLLKSDNAKSDNTKKACEMANEAAYERTKRVAFLNRWPMVAQENVATEAAHCAAQTNAGR
jgi:sugar/nucleoside kinase (ribokinase family)